MARQPRTVTRGLYATCDGTATAGQDYTQARSGTLTFPANSTTPQEIHVPILNDDRDEAEEETLTVTLSHPANASLAGGGSTVSASGTIGDDDDPRVRVSFEQGSYTVPEGGTTTVRVELDKDPERTVRIPLVATPQDGATPADYTVPQTVTFSAGETEKDITVTVHDDAVADDAGELVQLGFDSPLPPRVEAGSPATAVVTLAELTRPPPPPPPAASSRRRGSRLCAGRTRQQRCAGHRHCIGHRDGRGDLSGHRPGLFYRHRSGPGRGLCRHHRQGEYPRNDLARRGGLGLRHSERAAGRTAGGPR